MMNGVKTIAYSNVFLSRFSDNRQYDFCPQLFFCYFCTDLMDIKVNEF
jgi:hypothetical protein